MGANQLINARVRWGIKHTISLIAGSVSTVLPMRNGNHQVKPA